MNSRTLFLVSISALACQLVFPNLLLLAQVQSGLRESSVVVLHAESQQKTGDLYDLAGNVEIIYGPVRLTADQVQYNAATGQAVAAGRVHFFHLADQADLEVGRAEYNLRTGAGSFLDVHGSVGARIREGSTILTTTNPFFFTAERVERVGDNKYEVRNAQLTACTLPDPTWTLSTRRAAIYPGIAAVLYSGKLHLWKIPVFYYPFLYRPLRRIPRNTGFLMPSIGSNSRMGTVIGDSFYWAIHRSADLELGAEWLSARGWSQQATFRVRPSWSSYLNVSYFGVVDRGFGPQKVDQGGRTVRASGVASLPKGFHGVLDLNYLSSLTFREAFTQSYTEAVNSEVHSAGFVNKTLDSFSLNLLVSRSENFQSVRPGDAVTIRHLPQLEFNSVERPLWRGSPLRISWDSSLAGVSRSEPVRRSASAVKTSDLERMTAFPRVTLPLEWKGLRLTPAFGFRAARYGSRLHDGRVADQGVSQGTAEFAAEFVPPRLARAFSSAGPFYRQPFEHVIEPKVTFRSVAGARDLSDILIFDEQDRVSDTRQIELSLTNRLLAKREGGTGTKEILSWELRQQYYLDPFFGGALVPGKRNIFLAPLELSTNAFLDGPRRFSPLVSILRFRTSRSYDIEFREDYDMAQRRFLHGGLVGNARWGQAFASVSNFFVRSSPVLSPNFNQISFSLGYGNQRRVGWNFAAAGAYDIRAAFLQFTAFQMSYNNNCCGMSFEYRRFALGPVRNENQFRVAFSLANIGTFGNLKKQERLF